MLPNHEIMYLLKLLLVIGSEPVNALVNISLLNSSIPIICHMSASKLGHFSRTNCVSVKRNQHYFNELFLDL